MSAVPAAATGSASAAGVGPAQRTTTVVDEGFDVEVALTAVTPQIVQPGQELTVRATLTNTGTTPLTRPRVLVHRGSSSFISRSSLDLWRDGHPLGDLGLAVEEVDLPAPLAPGQTVDVAAVVRAGSLGLRTAASAWGPRGLALQVVDLDDPARRRQGLARTFVLWFPEQDVTATRISVLVPLVGPPVDPHDDDRLGALDRLTSPDGRLARVLAATGGEPDVTWVVDPWLLEAGGATAVPQPVDGLAPTDDDPPVTDPDADTPADAPGPDGAATDGDDGSVAAPGTRPGPGATADRSSLEVDQDVDGDDDGTQQGPGPGTDDAAVPPSVRLWRAGVGAAMTDRDVRLMPYLDADVAALAHVGAEEVFDSAVRRSEALAGEAGLPAGAGVTLVWPADDVPDLTTTEFVTRDEDRVVVAGPEALPAPRTLTYTPTGRTTVPADDQEATVLLPDERLSAALTDGLVPSMVGGDDDVVPPASGTPSPSPAVAAQDLLAELAVITRERPSDGRHLLLTVPRDWAPDVGVVTAQLAAIEAAPWVRIEPVSALVGSPDTGIDRGVLPERTVAPAEIGPVELATAETAIEERIRIAGMVERPDLLLDDLEAELLAPTSVAWRARPDERAQVVLGSVARTDALRGAVSVLPGSVLNLISTTGELPVRVRNGLDQAVTVAVTLRPGDPRLVADETVPVTVAAGGEEQVAIPVHAIQSADVAVAIELWTLDGELVDDGTVLTVRVRAEWEGIGTAVIGALLALGLVIGVVRTIRRGRTGRRAAPQAASGPDALSPEATADDEHPTGAPDPDDQTAAAVADSSRGPEGTDPGRGVGSDDQPGVEARR